MHMASAFDVPVIALFGPTAPAAGFAPLSSVAVTVEPPPLACRPCAERAPHSCPRTHWRCMREISPASVARKVHQLLAYRPLPIQ
jgi:heptosyltransferase II